MRLKLTAELFRMEEVQCISELYAFILNFLYLCGHRYKGPLLKTNLETRIFFH